MVLRTLYFYELKKLFFAKVNLTALSGAVIMLAFLVISSISGAQPVSREAAKELDGRVIDGELIEELKPAMKVENGSAFAEVSAEYEKYVPVMDVITSVIGYDRDLTRLKGTDFYNLREQELNQRIEKQKLSTKEKEFWRSQEARVSKPFVYHYHSGPANLIKSFQALGFFILLLSAAGLSGVYAKETADNMNQLLLCSRYGKTELYLIICSRLDMDSGSGNACGFYCIYTFFMCIRDGRNGRKAAVGETIVNASIYPRSYVGFVYGYLFAGGSFLCIPDYAAVCDHTESACSDMRPAGISVD